MGPGPGAGVGVAMCVSSNYSDIRCQHAISKASSVGVNSHPAFDEKPGINLIRASMQ